ncbi:D-hexose-6-phosphate mutarotase [Halopseudomonas salina]|uniref:Putative glucose-6-phosphate 1-epimerase n=1 Tax=Halopseudomonas salina TaxID=1323744 RepID=A0ABQ1PSZ9_9GAMM|nr:D-hexose-6-phosphate mutarotase [Halopseudomonas salina]GGD02750.1 D-hexose-6-phosphate mutarotase [Halopseudomonas salina]
MPSRQETQQLAAGVTRLRNSNGREFIEVAHPRVSARIALEGGHLVSCLPAGQKPLLWLSPQEPEVPGKPLRGGVPLCWPWFGNERSGPAHGIARTGLWELESVVVTDEAVQINLELPQSEMAIHIPDEHWKLGVQFILASDLQVTLTSTNTGSKAQILGQALHAYLPVSDITQVEIKGLDQASYLDQLTGKEEVQLGPVRFSQEVDRIYHGAIGAVQLEDAGETITVAGSGSGSTVIWNPWVKKSRRLGHFPEDGYREMLCIETANAGHDRRVLDPGETHSLSTRISHHV